MKKVPATIAVATAYAAFYQVAPFVGIPTGVIVALFVLSPFVVCYMAYVILKYGEPSQHTFEEKFYDDLDYWRNRKAPVLVRGEASVSKRGEGTAKLLSRR